MLSRTVGNCIVYGRHGETVVKSFQVVEPRYGPASDGRAAETPIAAIMNRSIVCARADLDIASIIRVMIAHHVGCMPVIDELRHPIGVITKWDLVEQLDAAMQLGGTDSPLATDLAPRIADEIMMPLALTLPESASVAQAAEMMTTEDTHHVLVVAESSTLVGIVSSKDIATWLVTNARAARTRVARGSTPMPAK